MPLHREPVILPATITPVHNTIISIIIIIIVFPDIINMLKRDGRRSFDVPVFYIMPNHPHVFFNIGAHVSLRMKIFIFTADHQILTYYHLREWVH